jgi:hypothetical protein
MTAYKNQNVSEPEQGAEPNGSKKTEWNFRFALEAAIQPVGKRKRFQMYANDQNRKLGKEYSRRAIPRLPQKNSRKVRTTRRGAPSSARPLRWRSITSARLLP